MNTRRHPRSLSDAWPTEADRTGIHHDDDDRARSVYSDADESAPRAWPFLWIIISIALLFAFGGPSAQQEAEDVADDAATAQMQAAIDRNCAGLDQRSELQCALDTLQELQPDRWIPEDAARARAAADYITNHPTN